MCGGEAMLALPDGGCPVCCAAVLLCPQDARFKQNPLVTAAPFIRFYAGCPLVCSNGMRLGSL
jgi:hypothetical protein